MHLRPLFLPVQLAVAIMASTPLLAQPQDGPWAADADGDRRISRDEMAAYMDRRFSLMDQDGDGLVPVPVMQRMLGHAPQDRVATPQGGGGRKGRGGPGGPPPGGSAPGGRPPAADHAAAGPPPGHAMPWPEDANDDGQIDRAEFLAPALTLFADRDRDGDGVLSAGELPPPPAGDGPPPPPPED